MRQKEGIIEQLGPVGSPGEDEDGQGRVHHQQLKVLRRDVHHWLLDGLARRLGGCCCKEAKMKIQGLEKRGGHVMQPSFSKRESMKYN